MAKLVIRQPYVDFDDPSVIVDFGPSLTHQSFADECNFNAVLARWETTGVIEHVNQAQPQYLDVSALPDYQSALNIVQEAQASFDALPSTLRERFSNNPGSLISFLADPSNRDEAIKLGLVDVPLSVDKSDSPQGAKADLSTEAPKVP